MESLKFRIVGVAPLLMHNGRLADPLDEFTRKIKEVSGKRNKVDADHEELARLEWLGGLYLSGGLPCIPSYVMEAALIGKGGAARKMKMGKQATAGMIVGQDASLEYDGPKDVAALWKDDRFRFRIRAVISGPSVMRTRAMFSEWAATIEVLYLPEMLNQAQIIQWMDIAGSEVGLMDWRPKFGRFTAELLNGSHG